MTERIEVGDLTARYLGRRVLITDGDTVVDGLLESFWVAHDYKRDPKFNYIEVKTATGEFKLKNVPLDYVIQVVPDETEDDD